jgi:hypothetical protein
LKIFGMSHLLVLEKGWFRQAIVGLMRVWLDAFLAVQLFFNLPKILISATIIARWCRSPNRNSFSAVINLPSSVYFLRKISEW